jgi:hypothetical protein
MMTVVARTGGVMIAHAIVMMEIGVMMGVTVVVVVTMVDTKAVTMVVIKTAAVMMIIPVVVKMEIGVMMVGVVAIATPPALLTPLVKSAQFMVTLQKIVGGVMRRIVSVVTMEIVATRMKFFFSWS